MFTKMVLPILGGSPAVWNTAVVFFQTTLLAGYLYAYASAKFLKVRSQALLHVALLAVVIAVLPLSVASGWSPPLQTTPVFWLLGLLAVSIGLPTFAVSASAPLLQSWFAQTRHKSSGDPYFLYGASNLGSLLALLGYPTVIAPLFGLSQQGRLWAWGYAALVIFIGLSGFAVWRGRRTVQVQDDFTNRVELVEKIDWPQRLRWILLSFAPSSLLLGVTLHISTDVAAAPFIWVVPLAIYLLTFVFVFARKPILKHEWMLHLQVFMLISLAVYFTVNLLWLVFFVHLMGLFVTAMVCHGELARQRPVTRHLTEFYLWMSVGGTLGGVFSALVAPVLFDTVLEYPLTIVIACLLRPTLVQGGRRVQFFDVALPAVLAGILVLQKNSVFFNPSNFGESGRLAFFIAMAIALYVFHQRPVRFALGIAAVLFVPQWDFDDGSLLARERSFFGISVVDSNKSGRVHMLRHGTTLHGIQLMDAAARREPLSYYGREGPLGQLFSALNQRGALTQIAAVGLGVGTVACYARPGQKFTFFEIDPWIERFARDAALFRYLSDCGKNAAMRLGDGRRSLLLAADGAFDLIILDAFSSDAIPVHLMTREALALYLRKLSKHGVIAFHISNNFVDLEPVLAKLAQDANLTARIQGHDPEEANPTPEGKVSALFASTWVVVARRPSDLASLNDDARWKTLQLNVKDRPWTDDYSNVFGQLIWTREFDSSRQRHSSETQ
jgi:spermidine synthase